MDSSQILSQKKMKIAKEEFCDGIYPSLMFPSQIPSQKKMKKFAKEFFDRIYPSLTFPSQKSFLTWRSFSPLHNENHLPLKHFTPAHVFLCLIK